MGQRFWFKRDWMFKGRRRIRGWMVLERLVMFNDYSVVVILGGYRDKFWMRVGESIWR